MSSSRAEEDWAHIDDQKLRKRVQNRVSQRKHRQRARESSQRQTSFEVHAPVSPASSSDVFPPAAAAAAAASFAQRPLAHPMAPTPHPDDHGAAGDDHDFHLAALAAYGSDAQLLDKLDLDTVLSAPSSVSGTTPASSWGLATPPPAPPPMAVADWPSAAFSLAQLPGVVDSAALRRAPALARRLPFPRPSL